MIHEHAPPRALLSYFIPFIRATIITLIFSQWGYLIVPQKFYLTPGYLTAPFEGMKYYLCFSNVSPCVQLPWPSTLLPLCSHRLPPLRFLVEFLNKVCSPPRAFVANQGGGLVMPDGWQCECEGIPSKKGS